MARAQRQAALAIADLRRTFEASPEYQQALADAVAAHLAYDRARYEALAGVRNSPEFTTIQLELYDAQKQLEAGRATGGSRQIFDLATNLLAKRSAMSKLEIAALADIPELNDLRFAMIDAQAKVYDLRRAFIDSIQADPAWRAARAQLDQIRSRVGHSSTR